MLLCQFIFVLIFRMPARNNEFIFFGPIISQDIILQPGYNHRNLCSDTPDARSTIQWLAERGLIANSMICANCNGNMRLVKYEQGIKYIIKIILKIKIVFLKELTSIDGVAVSAIERNLYAMDLFSLAVT